VKIFKHLALLSVVLIVAVVASCHSPEKESVTLYMAGKNNKGEITEKFSEKLEMVQKKYPYINAVAIEEPKYNFQANYAYDEEDMKELEKISCISSAYTEFEEIVSSGYAADLTEAMKQTGLDKKLNPDWIDFISKDGKIYAIPQDVYVQGLYLNKELFKQAGLVKEDGSIKFPKTYDELVEYSCIIKEKTGAAGFGIASAGRYGGWQLMNIAWSFGVKFVEKDFKGNWTAAFNSPEFVNTLQFLYDMRWKYDIVPENTRMDNANLINRFAANKVAMIINDPPANHFVNHNVPLDNVMAVSMPKGPVGAYAQMGGTLFYLNSNMTQEEIEACILYLIESNELRLPRNDGGYFEAYEKSLIEQAERGNAILDRTPLKIWLDGSETERVQEIRNKYVNTNPEDYKNFFAFDDVIIRMEEPINAQELYELLDGVIAEVFSNPDVDIQRLAAETAETFQREYLDVVNYKMQNVK